MVKREFDRIICSSSVDNSVIIVGLEGSEVRDDALIQYFINYRQLYAFIIIIIILYNNIRHRKGI